MKKALLIICCLMICTAVTAQPPRISKVRTVGKKVTNVQLPNTKGVMCNLTDYVGKGNVVLIDFWASWCRPCMMEMSYVRTAYNRYHKYGFNIVGISLDNNPAEWKAAIKNFKLNWTHLSDLQGWNNTAAQKYGIISIPSSILVSKQGKIIANDLRGEELLIRLRQIYGK